MTEENQGASPVEDAPPAPADAQAPADSSTAPETPADDAGTPAPRDEDGSALSRKVQQRIDQLTWERHQATREAEYWRSRAEQPVQPPKAEAPAEKPMPTLEAHGYDEAKYQVALLEYADKRAEAVVERRLTEAEKQRAEQARIETFVTRQKEFAKATPDFEDKVLRDPTLPISEAMREVILDSPSGPEIAYHLAGHRDVAERIARLPAHLAAFEIGRIEGRLTAEKAAKARPSTVTQAPPPAPSIDASAPDLTPRASSADSDQLSDDEWMRLRNKELKRKKG